MKLSDIKINPSNPRILKDDKFKKLVKSIDEFPKMMKLRPIVIDNDNMVLGGNMRLKALQELKYKEIPDEWVKKASELTDDEKQRFIIADNVGFGDWDWDLIANEWDSEEVSDWGLHLPVFNGEINEIEIVESFKESVTFKIECSNIEELEKLQTKLNTSKNNLSYDEFVLKTGL